MTDTSAAPQTPATPAAPSAPVTTPASATPTAPATTSHEDMVYKDQAAVDRAIGQRLEQERSKMTAANEVAVTKAREEATAEVTKTFLGKLVDTSTESIARDLKFHDPKDALRVIDRDKLPVKDGAPDGDAIKKALEDLVKAKPYLVAAEDDGKRKPASTSRPKMPDGNPDTATPPKKSATDALREFAAHR